MKTKVIKKVFKSLLLVFLSSQFLSCGKNSKSDKNAYVSAAPNAAPVNSQMIDSANTQSLAQGVSIGVVDISTTSPQSGYLQIKTTMRISDNGNAVDLPIVTTHNNPGDLNGSLPVLGLNMQVSARCPNVYCNPYYIMVNVSRAGVPVVQEGFKKFFDGSQMDRYLLVPPNNWLDFNSMVQALN